jgi:methyl-accepting chemotaxis protein
MIVYAIVILFLINGIVIVNAHDLMSSKDRIAHAASIFNECKETQNAIVDAETGQRGYIITGDTSYLEPYSFAAPTVVAHISNLRILCNGDQVQLDRITKIEELSFEKLKELNKTIVIRREKGFEAAAKYVRRDRGRDLMTLIRQVVSEMQNEERVKYTKRQVSADESLLYLKVGLIMILLRDLLLFSYFVFVLHKYGVKTPDGSNTPVV